jgi:hypothetical protein
MEGNSKNKKGRKEGGVRRQGDKRDQIDAIEEKREEEIEEGEK